VEVHTKGRHDTHQRQRLPFRKVYRVSRTPLTHNEDVSLTASTANLSGNDILVTLTAFCASRFHVYSFDLCVFLALPIYVELLLITFTTRAKQPGTYGLLLSTGLGVVACKTVNIQLFCALFK
jgi:hypothetical protein